MNSNDAHNPFLSALIENPNDESSLLVYSDWLEENGDNRGTYLRDQLDYRKSPNASLQRRLVENYPYRHLAWTAALEQAGVIEANLTNFEFAWWGTGIEPVRESAATFEKFRYHDQPPLPVELLNGTFEWLRQSELEGLYSSGPKWKKFCDETRANGYFVPIELERFLADKDLPARMKSCTDNYFQSPEANSYEIAEWDEGLFVTFYADSQYCVLWGILLPREPGRYAPILAGPPEALFPGIWGDGEAEFANENEQAENKPVLAASQFEQFLFREWIENEIWFATQWQDSLRPLTKIEQAYVDHLNRNYSGS